MENHAENVQTFENSSESLEDKNKIGLPDYGPLNNFDLLVQKKISTRVYKNVKKDLPKLIEEGLSFEQLHKLVLDYRLPHSLLFDYKKMTADQSYRQSFKYMILDFIRKFIK